MSTINTILIKRRLPNSPLDTLPVLSGGELGFNEKNYTLYYGASGLGTIPIAGPGAFVDRTTNQTVSGEKWFENKLTVDNDLIVTGFADVTSYVDANSYKIDGIEVIDPSRNATFVDIDVNDITANGNVTISGNLNVLGETTIIETSTTITSSFKVENFGTTTALEVTQVNGTNDVAVFKDGVDTALIVKGDGNVGIGTSSPTQKLTISGNVSSTGIGYFEQGIEVGAGGSSTATLYVQGTNVGINTETPNEELTVVGTISASQDIYAVNGNFTGTLDVDSSTTLGSTLNVTGATTLNSTLGVTGATTLSNSLSTTGIVEFDSTLTVDGLTTINNSLTITNDITGINGVSNLIYFIIDGGSF